MATSGRYVCPLAPCLAFGARSKLESEVATAQLIAEKTTIPIPEIHAYALGDGPGPFPSSAKRVNTIDLNMQELEGLAPSEIQDLYYGAGGTLAATNDYVAMLVQIADNAFSKGPGAASLEEGEDRLYHLHIFRQYAESWVDRSLDRGPFVSVHGDLEIFNLLLGGDMGIVSMLDWEWSRVVSCQFFKPPLWLSNARIEVLSYGYRYRDYLERFDKFLAAVRCRELERYGNELLANEWDKGKQKSGIMVANALENLTAMDWIASRYINLRAYGGKEDLPERLRAFIQDDTARKTLIEKKDLEWGASYTARLEQANANSIPLLTQTLPFAIGSTVVIIAGASYLSGWCTGLLPFSH